MGCDACVKILTAGVSTSACKLVRQLAMNQTTLFERVGRKLEKFSVLLLDNISQAITNFKIAELQPHQKA